MKRHLLKALVCLSVIVASTPVKAQLPVTYPRLLDQFSVVSWEILMARLDRFALDLQNNPNSIGVVLVYGGQDRKRGEAQAWSACLKDYLVNRRGVSAKRIIILNGGYRQHLEMAFWETDKNHMPNPAPQIKPKDVRFKGGRIKQWRRLCNI